MNHNKKNKPSLLLWLALLFPVLALACTVSVPSGNIQPPEQPTSETAQQIPSDLPTQSAGQPAENPNPIPTPTAGPTPTSIPVPQEVTNQEQLLTNLYARVHPSVVFITIYANQGGQVSPVAQGSGFVFDNAGHIVTNAHVVHGADQVEVTFYNNTVREAKVLGEDLNADLAVVQVDMPNGISALPLANMSSIAVGQTVIAVGNPFGLEGTMTQGIISALGRSIPALTNFNIPQAIQTDAAINPGNSGGPLLNLNGEVIGVNAQIETGGTSSANTGVGFAIPVSIVQMVVPDLIQKGSHDWTWLGIRATPGAMSPLIVQANKLPVDQGVYVSVVEPGGPADKAGLRGSSGSTTINGRDVETGGDVITAVDGQPMTTFEDLLVYLALNTQPGQKVTLTIIRNGQSQDVPVTLEKRPANAPQNPSISP
jgi:2-alkenal reductase